MPHMLSNPFWTSVESAFVLAALIAFCAICVYAAGIFWDDEE